MRIEEKSNPIDPLIHTSIRVHPPYLRLKTFQLFQYENLP
jgi:hypothetical protein